jgi:transcriptional regulator with XRE-family HTH domain
MSHTRELVARVLKGHHLTQVELAAAMNVAQPVVSNWASGVRHPSRPHRDVLERLDECLEVPAVRIGEARPYVPLLAPARPWDVVLRPSGRFRLPLTADWSGSGESRWRDARDEAMMDYAYSLVLNQSLSASTVVAWIDLDRLQLRFDSIALARSVRSAWAAHLPVLLAARQVA